MKKIEITPLNNVIGAISDALTEFEIDMILIPAINMEREHMIPRYGDWDQPPITDYRNKIEIIVSDDKVEQIIAIIQNVFAGANIRSSCKHGNEIFISDVEKVVSI